MAVERDARLPRARGRAPADAATNARRCAAPRRIVNTVEESKRLNALSGPMVIISASGMATGGRVVHHLKAFAPDPRNTDPVRRLPGGRHARRGMVAGAESVKIHGAYVPVARGSCVARQHVGARGLRARRSTGSRTFARRRADVHHARRAGRGGRAAPAHPGALRLELPGAGVSGDSGAGVTRRTDDRGAENVRRPPP